MVSERAVSNSASKNAPPEEARRGFTLVEVVVALVILAIGLLGLAGTTGFVVRQTTLSEVTTERSMARQSVVEEVRSMTFEEVDAQGPGSRTIGSFSTSWSVIDSSSDTRTVEVVTVGPGLSSGGSGPPMLTTGVADTLTFRVVDLQ